MDCGISKINNALASANMPPAQIHESNGGLNIVFYKSAKAQRLSVVNDVVKSVVNDVAKPFVNDVVKLVVDDVVEMKVKILNYLKENNRLSAKQIASLLNISERTIQRHYKSLQNEKMINRVGSTRNRYWKLLSKATKK